MLILHSSDLDVLGPPDDPCRGRSRDFPEGSAPQLIDVLNALIDGQGLLLLKTRRARLEIISSSGSGTEESTHAPCNPEPLHSIGTTGICVSPDGAHREIMNEGDDFAAEPVSVEPLNTFETPRQPSASNPVAPTGTTALEQGASPLNRQAVVTIQASSSVDGPNQTSADDDGLYSAQRDGAAAQAKHDYNFFDELDARLAHLHVPDGQLGEP